MSNEILIDINENGVATIILNRPQVLNSLSYKMVETIRKTLTEWKENDNIKVVVIKGAGDKGLCAGGDIKTLYEARNQGESAEKARQFFTEEYQTDLAIAQFPKPIIACLDGIVMGGGVGLTYGASHRIVTERTKWAMPEMNIGFFPDVGAAFFLNRAPGFTGRYLALTASIIKAADVLYIKGADIYMEQKKMNQFLTRLKEVNWLQSDVDAKLESLIASFAASPSVESELAGLQTSIDEHFSHQSVEEIISSLEKDQSVFAVETRDLLLSKAPVSLKVALQQLQNGEGKSLEECLAVDLVLAKNFLLHDDFYEGVRSVLIDKDRNPQYKYKSLADVSPELVQRFFNP